LGPSMVRPARHIVRDLRELTGPQRAAVLVMYLEPPVARRLLAQLSSGEIKQISSTIDSLDEIAPSVIDEVVGEFLAEFRGYARGSAGTSAAGSIRRPTPRASAQTSPSTVELVEIDHDFAVKIASEQAHQVAAALEGLDAEVAAAALNLMGNENAQRVAYAMPTATRRHLARLSTRLQSTRFGGLSSDESSRIVERVEAALQTQKEAERQRRVAKPERGVPATPQAVIGRESLGALVAPPLVKTGVGALIRTGEPESAKAAAESSASFMKTAVESASIPEPVRPIAVPRDASGTFPETAYEAFAALVQPSTGFAVARPDPTGRQTRVPGVLELVRAARAQSLAVASSGDAASQVACFIDALPFHAEAPSKSVAKSRLPKRAPNAQRAPIHRMPRGERRRAEAGARALRTLPAVNTASTSADAASVRLAEVMQRADTSHTAVSPIAWMAMQMKSAAPRTEKSPTLALFAPSPVKQR